MVDSDTPAEDASSSPDAPLDNKPLGAASPPGIADSHPETSQPSVVGNDWLRLEFEQNFEHLRDRDEKILSLVKFYTTTVLGVGSVAVALFGLKNLPSPHVWIGTLLVMAAVLGELVFFLLTSLRSYFVTSARQLNAIRNHYAQHVAREILIQPTDSSYPKRLRFGSAHMFVLAVVALTNAALLLLGAVGISYSLIPGATLRERLVIAISMAVALLVGNCVFAGFSLSEETK